MTGSTTPQRRPGGRSARVREAVAEAALEQLLSVGYQGMTLRGVAQAAGVAETTVYRRWPTTSHLTAAALLRLASRDNPVPDTGSLASDLRSLLSQIVALLNRPEVMRAVRSAAAIDGDAPEVVAAKDAFFDHRFQAAASIVERAVARGEIPPGTDPDFLIEALVAPAYLRALLLNRPLDERLVDECVTLALATCRQPSS